MVYIYMYIYMHIYIERERERRREDTTNPTPFAGGRGAACTWPAARGPFSALARVAF